MFDSFVQGTESKVRTRIRMHVQPAGAITLTHADEECDKRLI